MCPTWTAWRGAASTTPGNSIWLDRSWEGGPNWEGLLGRASIPGTGVAKLTEKGMLRASFVPPAQIRVLRDYTRMRVDLVRDRTRYWQRLEKLLEDALIKLSSVASSLDTVSARDMIEALIRGERDPQVLAAMARRRMKA